MLQNMDFKSQYLEWIRSNTEVVSNSSGTIRLTTPFLDVDNDFTEIYIKNIGEKVLITDAGETISNLELSGFKMSAKRRAILQTIASSNGIVLKENNELCTECTMGMFGLKANSLVQCIIKVSDMLVLSDNSIKTLFSEDVKNFLDDNDIRYMQNVSFIGKSTFYANYDFVIPKSKNMPERFITPINSAKENIIKSTIFTWEDVKPSRDSNCILYGVINDTNKEVSVNNITALHEYGIKCVSWSERNNIVSELSA